MLRKVSRVTLAIAAGGVVVHAFAGGAIPVVVALVAALAVPAAVVGASVPPGPRGAAATVALAAILVAAAATVSAASGRIATGAGGAEIAAWLLSLLVLLGVAPAIVLGWAHAALAGPREPDREGPP